MKRYNKFVLLLAVLTITACGEKKEEKEEFTISDHKSPGSPAPSNSDALKKEVVQVTLSANDQMQFSKTAIKVKAGSIVKLTFTHTGKMNEKVMGHNFVLLKKGTGINGFSQKAIKAVENNYIPENGRQVIAYTEMIGGGESITIEFKAPKEGTYDFICSFPGHSALMKGKFIVE